ncbi:uncharacterized protein [Drosophila kikkawai]|uniref:Uncharacterized protein n=1 Tax=Drosophila kikkawai TaxID=30033 RepID=A0A6P4JP51_DROKI|nr:uncharacterized protein LOC108085340 [Drosophila kikkawai]KAH8334462.1 hypothetical protein KR059_010443 [Drosophila kikkawai]
MDYIESTLLPFIMELISRQDNMCTTVDELTEAVKDAVLAEHIHPFGTLELAVRFALEVGSNMGILTLNDEVVPEPFNFNAKKPTPRTRYTAAQGRKAVKRVQAKSRGKPKPKVKACAGKRLGKKPVAKKQAVCKVGRKGAGQIRKAKPKKQC